MSTELQPDPLRQFQDGVRELMELPTRFQQWVEENQEGASQTREHTRKYLSHLLRSPRLLHICEAHKLTRVLASPAAGAREVIGVIVIVNKALAT